MTGNRMTPDEVCEAFGIKKAAYYERLKFLGIKAYKDENGNAYLDDGQFETLDQLNDHIKATGRMDGFSGTVSSESSGGIVVQQSGNAIAAPVPNVEGNYQSPSFDMDQLMREAAELKAHSAVLPDLIKLHLAGQMTLDDLPADLKEKVAAVRAAATPKANPAAVASDLLNRYRASRGGN